MALILAWIESLHQARHETRRGAAVVYDHLPPGGLDRTVLDEEQSRALERFQAAEAELDRLRVEWQLAATKRREEPE